MSTLNVSMPSLRKAAPIVKAIVYGRDKSACALIALRGKLDKAAKFATGYGAKFSRYGRGSGLWPFVETSDGKDFSL